MRRSFAIPFLLTALTAALVFAGCADVGVLQARLDAQQKQIQSLKEDNKQFQDAYYQVKETMDKQLAEASKKTDALQRDLDQARNLRTQKESDLANQLRTRSLELDALKAESDEALKRDAAKIGQLQRDKQSLTAERDAALAKIVLAIEQLRQAQRQIDDLTKQAAQLKMDLQASRDAQAAAQKSFQLADAALKQRQAELEQANKSLSDARGQAQAAETRQKASAMQAEDLAAQNKQLAAKAEQLQKAMDQANKQSKDAQAATRRAEQLQGEIDKLKERLRQSQASAHKAPQNGAAPAPAIDPALASARDAFRKEGDASITTRLDAEGLHLTIPSDALFKKNAIVLSDGATELLGPVVKLIKSVPGHPVRVIGHTDNQSVADLPFADNWGLGFARADRVREYLMRSGKIAGSRLTASTRAQADPIADNDKADGRARNRRVEIVIAPAAR